MKQQLGKKTFIIAEAGVNHNGCLKTARALIDVAVMAGADAVKFQTFTASQLVIQKHPHYVMLKKLELSKSDHRELMVYCKNKNILFMSSVFGISDVDLLNELGVEKFKVPSGEITHLPLLEYVARCNKPIILSTGMSTLEEVRQAVEVVQKINPKIDLSLLHCVSEYPTPPENSNLLAIPTLIREFGLPVGFSDHSLGTAISFAAVALGATLIEKHFTLDPAMEGPDHRVSLDPQALKTLVEGIRAIEKAFGTGIKIPTQTEEITKQQVRKSLVSCRNLKCGEIIQISDLSIKRPAEGISPMQLKEVLNKKILLDIPQDTPLKKIYFE